MRPWKLGLGILMAILWFTGCAYTPESSKPDSAQGQEAAADIIERMETDLARNRYWQAEAEKSWEEFYKSLEDQRERVLWKEAMDKIQPYLVPGEYLSFDFVIERDAAFPESGSAILYCSRWKPDRSFLSFSVWITVTENQEIASSDNYVKNLLRLYLFQQNLAVYEPETKTPYGASEVIERYSGRLLVGYENQRDLPVCTDAFSAACLRLKEDLADSSAKISQGVSFVEADSGTGMVYFQDFYPSHTIDISTVSAEELDELSLRVQSENLAVMKNLRPKLYEAYIKDNGFSWADYIKQYRTPAYTYSYGYTGLKEDSYGGPFRSAYPDSVRRQDIYYEQYRKAVENNQGKASEFFSERYQKYNYQSLDLVLAPFGKNGYERCWAISNDMFSITFPSGFAYAYEKNVSMDMVVPDNRDNPYYPLQDMEIPDIRAVDKGRFYLLFLQLDQGEENLSLIRLVETEKVKARLTPILRDSVYWEAWGDLQSDYHQFEYVKGQTELRNTAVYMPHMENGEKFVYLLVFEEFKDSSELQSLFKLQEEMVRTFVMLPYRYRCKRGDNLEMISRLYTGSELYVNVLCENPLNQIQNPDWILEGQYIEIPLHLLLKPF